MIKFITNPQFLYELGFLVVMFLGAFAYSKFIPKLSEKAIKKVFKKK